MSRPTLTIRLLRDVRLPRFDLLEGELWTLGKPANVEAVRERRAVQVGGGEVPPDAYEVVMCPPERGGGPCTNGWRCPRLGCGVTP